MALPPLPKFDTPFKWSSDPAALLEQQYWKDSDGPGRILAEAHKLGPTEPVMHHQELTLIRTANTFYLWNELSDSLFKIVEPANFEGILAAINSSKSRSVEALKLEEVEREHKP